MIDFKTSRVPFGTYVMAYVGTNNSMEARSVPAISLKQSNIFGGYFFLSLESMRVLHSRKWVELPFAEEVLEKGHEYAKGQHQPFMHDNLPIFELAPGESLDESDDDDHEDHSINGGDCENNIEILMNAPVVSEEEERSNELDDEEDTMVDQDEVSSMISEEHVEEYVNDTTETPKIV